VVFPHAYAERVYAGVLGKLIGVYLGRPVEGWTYERIAHEVGEVDRYLAVVNGAPLVVTDDDISGTFTFLRVLEDEGYPEAPTHAQIGRNWLNYTIERRTMFWWGGVGHSTEHTAYARLRQGIAPPDTGSRARNGKVLSEQIGAQIFIDGWAMVAPGDPERAADLARRAACISHDGEAIYGAQVIAAMESLAFLESDVNTLIDAGLAFIPKESTIARLIQDVRAWHTADPDWRSCRANIAAKYGLDAYPGNVHVVPNHGVIINALLYGEGDFHRTMTIVNTSGWDTDCNSGNLGCLLGIRSGLATFDGAIDWRGPVADRMYLSTADGGRAITDALTESYRIVEAAHAIRNVRYSAPKQGAKFHFTLRGSVQGFEIDSTGMPASIDNTNGGALRILPEGKGMVRVMTPTFIPEEALTMPGYELIASPSIFSGQMLTASLRNDGAQPVRAGLACRHYGRSNRSELTQGPKVALEPGRMESLTWLVPDTGGLPIHAVGIEIEGGGVVALETLTWGGAPNLTFRRPVDPSATLWRRAWVDAVDHFAVQFPEWIRLSQNHGYGLLTQGTRDWSEYRIVSEITPYMAKQVGIAIRVQGLKRYYALVLTEDQVASGPCEPRRSAVSRSVSASSKRCRAARVRARVIKARPSTGASSACRSASADARS
jgi:ADP-ribosylglycohydrolase